MTDEILTAARAGAIAALDTGRRPWIVGIAHLTGVPLDAGEFSREAVESVIEIATSTVDFPAGPVGYIPSGFVLDYNADYQLIRVVGDGAPHLEMQLGLGIAGFVAVGLTRSDLLDDGTAEPGAVVLSDIESVVADTFVLAIGAALELDYTGDIDYLFSVIDSRADVEPTYFAIDEESGELRRVDTQGRRFEDVESRAAFTAQTQPRDVHMDIIAVGSQIALQFGTEPQLVALKSDDHVGYQGDPLAGNRRRAERAEQAGSPNLPSSC